MENVARYFLAFGIVFGLLAIVVRRFGTPNGTGPFAVLGAKRAVSIPWTLDRVNSLRLTPQHTVHIVKVGDQAWVLGCSPSGICLVGSVPQDQGAAPTRGAHA